MNFLRKKLDDLKRPFGKGQKWERYAPAVNAFDTFLFVPNHTTHSGAHIRDAVDLKRTMVTVIIALLPVLIYGIYNTGYQYFIQIGEAFTFSQSVFNNFAEFSAANPWGIKNKKVIRNILIIFFT